MEKTNSAQLPLEISPGHIKTFKSSESASEVLMLFSFTKVKHIHYF